MRAAVRRGSFQARGWVNLLAALWLLAGLVVPLVPVVPAAAQSAGPPPLPTPTQVALSGTFQTALGCPADNDPTCPATQLPAQGDGSFAAILPVPPGDYNFRVVATSDQTRSLGEGGDPNGADLPLSVPNGAAGAYFSYDSLSGQIKALPVDRLVELTTDQGQRVPMAPIRQGGYRAFFDAPAGNYGFQILVGGQQVANDTISLDQPRRVVVTVDNKGNVTNKDTVRDTILTVTRVGADGAPLPGACFAILDKSGALQTQACDADDGANDGTIQLRVPNGLDQGTYTLHETQTPNGAPPAADQNVDLGPGRQQVTAGPTAQPATTAAETPAASPTLAPIVQGGPSNQGQAQPGRLVLRAVDAAGQRLPGACYTIVELGVQSCDTTGNGAATFDGVPPGTYTIAETTPPAGGASVANFTVDVPAGGARIDVQHTAAASSPAPTAAPAVPATAAPTEAAQPSGQTGALTVTTVDASGAPVTGACFQLTDRDSGAQIAHCDADDGANDGTLRFDNLPAGRYRLDETKTPDGFTPASGQNVQIAAGQAATLQITYQPAQGQTGELVIVVRDDAGQPVGQTCFDLSGAAAFNDVCDQQNDGTLNIPGIPAGDYRVHQTQTAPGFDLAADQTATVPANGTARLQVVNPHTAATAAPPTETPAPTETAIPTATTAPTETTAPTATTAPPAIVPIGGTETPAAVETAPAQTTPAETPATGTTGSIRIVAVDANGAPAGGGCYGLVGPTSLEACDNAANDADPADGAIRIDNLPPGAYQVFETRVPPGVQPAADVANVQLQAGERLRVAFAPGAVPTAGPDTGQPQQPAAQTGELEIVVTATDGSQPAGTCASLSGPATIGPLCDNADLDRDPAADRLLVTNVPAGDYTVIFAPPAGYQPAPQQTVTVQAGQRAQLDLSLTPKPQAPGAVEATLAGPDGAAVGGCVALSGPQQIGPVCDNQNGDAASEAGRIRIENVPAGTYTLTLSNLPTAFATPAPQSIQVAAGQTATAAISLQRGTGTLTLFVEDPSGARIGGSCFTLTGPETLQDICDRGDDGVLNFPDMPAGDYTIHQERALQGFTPAADQKASVPSGGTAEATIVNQPVPATATPTPAPTATATATPLPTATPSPTALPTATTVPTATAAPTATTVPTVSPTQTPAPGTIEIHAVDAKGQAVDAAGGCYAVSGATKLAPVCDNGRDDADNRPGVIAIAGVPAGAYTVNQTTPPQGFAAARPTGVTVQPGQTTRVDVVVAPLPAPTGSLVVSNTGPDGRLIGGGCFSVLDAQGNVAAQACDNDRNDRDNRAGVVGFANLDAGQYTVRQTRAPQGFDAAPDQRVRITGNAEQDVTMQSAATAPETGGAELQAFDEVGQPIPGQCFVLNHNGAQQGPYCANDQGVATVNDLPVGVYEAVAQNTQETATGATGTTTQAQAIADRRSFTVGKGQRVRVPMTIRRQKPTTGTLVISVVDQRGRPLDGACFTLRGGGNRTDVCDNKRGDADATTGQIRLNDVAAGSYTLSQTTAPAGFQAAADQSVTIDAGRTERVTITNTPAPPQRGGLTVQTVDPAGKAVPGACFLLLQGVNTTGPVCDDADGANDGTTTFGNVQDGAYLVRMSSAPDGFSSAGDTAVRVTPGQTAQVKMTVTPRPGAVLIAKTDANGAALSGACFALIRADGGTGYQLCDNDANDANPAAGLILLNGVAPGDYVVRETQTPAGYQTAGDQRITVAAGQRADVTVTNTPVPPPPQTGSLAISKVDSANAALPGACFALLQGNATIASRCDSDDGSADGVITFTQIGVGTYTLRETRRPSAAYQPIADHQLSIAQNRTTRLTVQNQLRPGRVVVNKTNQNGNALQDACFDLQTDGQQPLCSDANGQIVFDNLAPGIYKLVETQAPAGYLPAAPVTNIVVNPGATTTVAVEDQLAPPPPNTGSIRVIKFTCPAGEAGTGTRFIDSSNPGGNQLTQTAGCAVSDASFRLTPANGGKPLEFSTGADGIFQTTMPAGDYLLQETSPDLPGDQQEPVTIFVNQQTTVVVLNDVAPPAPAPASVAIRKYTCAPGFQGTVFADFVAACLQDQNLTNNVVFRLAGQTTVQRVTGDIGQQGKTQFVNLTPGAYTLTETAPSAAQTTYAFCGLDADNPTSRIVGTGVDLRLVAGQAVTCTWFNVPDQVTTTTGTIVVHKLGCAATSYPPNFDWYGQCQPQGAGVRFALSVFDGKNFVPRATGATNDDGLLTFAALPPGTYALQEVGGAWCRAQSDSVDAQGNIVVAAGQRANVWIFNCLGTRNPPNTGAGPLAGPAPSPLTGALLGFSLVWPLAGLAWLRFGRRAA